MTGLVWLPPLVVFAFFLGSSAIYAQSMGPDEAVSSRGAVIQKLGLTPAQQSALYNAVLRQRIRAVTTQIEPAVGAPVAPAVPLSELPDQAGIDDAMFLKYAMVAEDVVIVDPIRMRVVDVIHGSNRP